MHGIAVHGQQVEIAAGRPQQGQVPVEVGGAGGGHRDPVVHPAYHLRGLADVAAPLGGVVGADLPGAVVLVAYAPETDFERVGVPVVQACPGMAALAHQVAVLDPVAHLLGPAGAGVAAQVGLGPDRSAESYELVSAKGVGLLGAPCLVVRGARDGPPRRASGSSTRSSRPATGWSTAADGGRRPARRCEDRTGPTAASPVGRCHHRPGDGSAPRNSRNNRGIVSERRVQA